MSQERGTPINKAALPEWARSYLSEAQQGLANRALQWVLMFDHTAYLESSARDLCRRFHIASLGNDDKSAHASQATLARWTGWSEETVRTAIKQLEKDGWIVVVPGRPTRYRLAWPHVDPNTHQTDLPELCARPNKDKTLCTRRLGWGTTTQGIGPCKNHGGTPKTAPETSETPQWLGDSGEAQEPKTPQPLGDGAVDNSASTPQPLGDEPVDKPGEADPASPSTPQPLGEDPPTIGGAKPQPLGPDTPTIGAVYVLSTHRVYVESENEGCSSRLAEVEGPGDPRRPDEPGFSLDEVKMSDGWRAAARRRLPPDVDPEYLEAYATALATAELTQGTFRVPEWASA